MTDPARPTLVSRIGPVKGTHKNWWECDTGIAYLVSGLEGWRTRRMAQVVAPRAFHAAKRFREHWVARKDARQAARQSRRNAPANDEP